MAVFSGNRAVSAGFRLIGREPLAFLVWTLVYAVVAILPQLWILASLFSAMPGLEAEAQLSPEAFFDLQARMMALQPISLLSSLLSFVLLTGAVFRGALQPQDRSVFYLRLGAQELWLGLTGVVVMVVLVIAMLVMMIPLGIVIGVAAAAGGEGTAALVTFPLAIVLVAVFVWLMLRTAPALPMSFAERNFRLMEAWSLSKGQAGKMFLVAVVLWIIAVAAQLVVFGLAVTVLVGTAQTGDLAQAWLQDPGAVLARISPAVWVGIAAVWALFATWCTTLFGAAFASIYRDLRDTAEA